MRRLYDLTHPVGVETPVFPGDEPVRVRPVASISIEGYRASRVEVGTHSGTHVDAPAHLFPDGVPLSDLPLDLWVGPALVIDARDFPRTSLDQAPRLLLAGCPDGIDPEWARRIAAAGVRLVGVDGPSVDPIASSELPVHRELLAAGIVLVENLRLAGIPRGPGTLYCLPLPIVAGDGAPARVLWEPEHEGGAHP